MFVSPLGNFYQQRAGNRRMPRDISKFWLIPAAVHCILCVELWTCLFVCTNLKTFPALRPQTYKINLQQYKSYMSLLKGKF
jgi:hypothetical protein